MGQNKNTIKHKLNGGGAGNEAQIREMTQETNTDTKETHFYSFFFLTHHSSDGRLILSSFSGRLRWLSNQNCWEITHGGTESLANCLWASARKQVVKFAIQMRLRFQILVFSDDYVPVPWPLVSITLCNSTVSLCLYRLATHLKWTCALISQTRGPTMDFLHLVQVTCAPMCRLWFSDGDGGQYLPPEAFLFLVTDR